MATLLNITHISRTKYSNNCLSRLRAEQGTLKKCIGVSVESLDNYQPSSM